MRIVAPGQTAKFVFKFRNESTGDLVAITSPQGSIFDISGSVAATTASLSAGDATGSYTLSWAVPAGTTVGTYRAIGFGTYGGETVFADSPYLFEVSPATEILAYASVGELITYLDLAESEITNFALVRDILYAASSAIDRYCGRSFIKKAYTHRENIYKQTIIFVEHYPIVSISSITVDTTTTLTSDDYYVYYDTGKVEFDVEHTGELVLAYTSGLSSIPQDIHAACLRVASKLFNTRRKEGVSNETLLSYSYSMDPRIFDDSIKDLLNSYKHVHMR